ncbi:hypothetical protein SLE2022_291330 [Rubroshorea leprosula]
MENSGEAIDDQSSGWFEVKKKHRNSSKFSLQSWVGGFSAKNTSNSPGSEPSLNESSGNLQAKPRSQLQKPERSLAVNSQSAVVNYTQESNKNKEDEGHDKCVVKEDGKSSKLPPLFVTDYNDSNGGNLKILSNDRPNMVQKIKWGDLEDDALVTIPGNNVGVEIKFGDIGNGSLLVPRKHENNSNLSSSSIDLQEKMLVAASSDVNIHSQMLTPNNEIVEETCTKANGMPSEVVEVPVVNENIIDEDADALICKEIDTEHIGPVMNDQLSSSYLSCKTTGKVVELQVPDVTSEVFESKNSEVTVAHEGSNTEVAAQDAQSLQPKKNGPKISSDTIETDCVGGFGDLQDVRRQDDMSKAQTITVTGEGDEGESKERFRQRLWCFLFENLNRAVDELYLLCELECDVEQMKEATLVLEEAASDFKELTSRVEDFENVKSSCSQSVNGASIASKTSHRRPHALSWEVRRMTTSPHRAEILSSSLEAFRKIQQERAIQHQANSLTSLGVDGSSHAYITDENMKKTTTLNDGKDSATKLRKQNRGSDLTQSNINGEKRNIESNKSSKANSLLKSSSDDTSSRPPFKDHSSASGTGKSRREVLGSETEKVPPKKEKLLEDIGEKKLRSMDHLKRQIPTEKDKDKKNATSWKSMDAWKEKRNWEDILSSPFRVSSRISHSPGMGKKSAERLRTLHEKLMSPEKKKKKKTALDLKKEAEEKHARAMRIRTELENERVQKLQRTSQKLIRVNEWQAVRTMKLREGMYARHQRSESRHEAFLAEVVRRAGDESSKVNEVRFITSLNEENKKLMLRQKLHDSELRRAEKLQLMKTKQKEDMAREEAVLERRRLIEAEKLQRLAETQRRKEEAQLRREEERRASSAAREARAIEQLRRKEERAKAQQEEAELLAQKLAERLRESEQRRKFYLEQIRERASMDFRDQSSPLPRRSVHKDSQGRSTPTNNSDDYQANGSPVSGTSVLATGDGTLQHSLKRRIKRIRQRLMALKFDFPEPPAGLENAGLGYRTAVGTARAKIGRWLQELQKLRQARKEGASSIGLITAEMIKFLEGKDPELQASRQAGLLDFIASALPASHTSKPEAGQVTIHLLKLLRVVLSAPTNRSYFLAQNLLPPIIPMLSAALENYIKIAASLNAPGNANSPPSKSTVENFESISEVLDGFLWTVSTIIGHVSSDERQQQMRDGLLELLIAYQVIHRLRDLFALYDRPQVEGSPFPSSILLSIYLLVVLTSSPTSRCSINWEFLPVEVQDVDNAAFADSGCSSVNNSGDGRPSLSVLNGITVTPLPDVPEDRPLEELHTINRGGKLDITTKDSELKLADSLCESQNASSDQVDVADEFQKTLVEQKDEKRNENTLSLKQPVAFLLSAISETGLVSLPSLLTSVLLQATNKLSSEQASYVLPSNFEEVATGVLKVMNNLALLDIKFMQRILARPDLKMEFFHLMSFLLSHCNSKWKVPNDQIGLLLLESLLLLGHFALFHPENQAVLRWGKSPTILHKVCDLPFTFFSDPELMPVLAGTLLAACYGCGQNKAVVQQELSMDMLLSLLRSCRNVLPTIQSNSTLENLPAEDSNESNQQGSDSRKPQGDISLRSGRYNARNTRLSLGKGAGLGNSLRVGKNRSQRDIKPAKNLEESVMKQNLPVSETSVMLHYRFPSSFIDRAEQFFSADH